MASSWNAVPPEAAAVGFVTEGDATDTGEPVAAGDEFAVAGTVDVVALVLGKRAPQLRQRSIPGCNSAWHCGQLTKVELMRIGFP